MTDKDKELLSFYRDLLDRRKDIDIIITRRAGIFVTANTLLFFVFREPITKLLVPALILATVLNWYCWFLTGWRTKVSMKQIHDKEQSILCQLSKTTRDCSFEVKPFPALKGSKLRYSSTDVLCHGLPVLFGLAWFVFFHIAIL